MSAMMTLCWSWRRALGTMGCPWCEYDEIEHRVRFEPVPGWTAKKRVSDKTCGFEWEEANHDD